MVEAIAKAHEEIKKIVEFIETIAKEVNKSIIDRMMKLDKKHE